MEGRRGVFLFGPSSLVLFFSHSLHLTNNRNFRSCSCSCSYFTSLNPLKSLVCATLIVHQHRTTISALVLDSFLSSFPQSAITFQPHTQFIFFLFSSLLNNMTVLSGSGTKTLSRRVSAWLRNVGGRNVTEGQECGARQEWIS